MIITNSYLGAKATLERGREWSLPSSLVYAFANACMYEAAVSTHEIKGNTFSFEYLNY